MKKNLAILLTFTIISVFLVVSCGKNSAKADNKPVETPQVSTSDLKTLFPYSEGIELTYNDGLNNIKVKIEELSNNSITISHEEKTKIDFSNEGIKSNEDFLLKLPVEKNASWETSKGKATIKNDKYVLSTALGNIETIEVEIENYATYYIARNFGIVKIINKKEGKETSYELIGINAPSKESKPVETPENPTPSLEKSNVNKVFYYDVVEDRMVYTSVKEQVVDKNNAPKVFESLFKNSPNSDISPLMPSNTKIKSIDVDKKSSTVTIDVSEVFTETMNLGSSGEIGVLNGIAYTLGNTYNCENVVITVNGGKFTTGHSDVSKENPIKAEPSKAEKLN